MSKLIEFVDRRISPLTTLNVFKSETPVKAVKLIACLSTQHQDQLSLRLVSETGTEYWYPAKAFSLRLENPNVKIFIYNESQNIYGFTLDLFPRMLYGLDVVNGSGEAHIIYYLALLVEEETLSKEPNKI